MADMEARMEEWGSHSTNFDLPLTEVKEVRRGLFTVKCTYKHLMMRLDTFEHTIQLCGSQSGRSLKIICDHKPQLGEIGYFTVTVEDDIQEPILVRNCRKAVRRSPAPRKLLKSELIPPVCIWMKQDESNSGNSNSFRKTSSVGTKTEKWEVTCSYRKKKPEKLLLWIDFGTNTETERQVISGLGKLFYDQKQCDVQFQFKNGQSISAHALILSAGSPVFAAMFQCRLSESQTRKVDIVDIEMEVFRQLVICLYTGRAPKLAERVITPLLFQAADKYGVETLKKECLDELLAQLTISNAIEMLIWSHFNYVPQLFESAMDIFLHNSRTLCYRPDWKDVIEKYPDLCLLVTQRIVGPPPYPTIFQDS